LEEDLADILDEKKEQSSGLRKLYKLLNLIDDPNQCPWLHLTDATRKAVSLVLSSRQIEISEFPTTSQIHDPCVFSDQIYEVILVTITSYQNNNERRSFYMHKIFHVFFSYIHFIVNLRRNTCGVAHGNVNEALIYCFHFIRLHNDVGVSGPRLLKEEREAGKEDEDYIAVKREIVMEEEVNL